MIEIRSDLSIRLDVSTTDTTILDNIKAEWLLRVEKTLDATNPDEQYSKSLIKLVRCSAYHGDYVGLSIDH